MCYKENNVGLQKLIKFRLDSMDSICFGIFQVA